MRVAEGSYRAHAAGGWLHRLTARDETARGERRPAIRLKQLPDFSIEARRRADATTYAELGSWAVKLGVSIAAMRRLDFAVPIEAPDELWCPMREPKSLRVIGVKRRLSDGRKLCRKGDRVGVAMPRDLEPAGTLLVCEGESDAAAALTLGFEAVGRPGADSCDAMLEPLATGRSVVVVADDDCARGHRRGEESARRLANRLRLFSIDVRVILPADPAKDLRDWIRNGATRDDVQRRIDDAKPVELKFRVHVGGRR